MNTLSVPWPPFQSDLREMPPLLGTRISLFKEIIDFRRTWKYVRLLPSCEISASYFYSSPLYYSLFTLSTYSGLQPRRIHQNCSRLRQNPRIRQFAPTRSVKSPPYVPRRVRSVCLGQKILRFASMCAEFWFREKEKKRRCPFRNCFVPVQRLCVVNQCVCDGHGTMYLVILVGRYMERSSSTTCYCTVCVRDGNRFSDHGACGISHGEYCSIIGRVEVA